MQLNKIVKRAAQTEEMQKPTIDKSTKPNTKCNTLLTNPSRANLSRPQPKLSPKPVPPHQEEEGSTQEEDHPALFLHPIGPGPS